VIILLLINYEFCGDIVIAKFQDFTGVIDGTLLRSMFPYDEDE